MIGPEFALLGPLRVRRDGRDLPIAGRHARALLAYLVLQPNRLVTTDRLIAALWRTPPQTASKIVQITVSQLRKNLGGGVLISEQRGYRLAARVEDVDVERFTRLAAQGRSALAAGRAADAAGLFDEALALWRGEFLADLNDEPFVAAERARVEQLRLAAEENRFDALLALGRHAELVPELEALARAEPLRERVRGQLMLALYRDGRQAEALGVYADARRLLVEEIGIEPGPALKRLQRAILVHDPALEFGGLTAGRSTLPAPAAELIGREEEIETVLGLLTDLRLVTLTGPGGVGKTRLALEAGRRLETQLPGGVVFVPLDTLSDPSLVAATILRALGAETAPTDNADSALAELLRGRSLLLILDSMEHLLAAAPRIAWVLAAAPRLKVLVTSREALRVSAEREVRVGPLPVPSESEAEAARLARNPAVQLFLSRAGKTGVRQVPTLESARAVAEVCRRLEGLPLSIELAAARTRSLNPAALLSVIRGRLDLPGSGTRDAPPRQRSLRATLDWSFELLSSAERVLFARLGVFAGDFALEAAAAVCREPQDSILRGVESLVDKSLVTSSGAAEPRFAMLDTIREYAIERLEEEGAQRELRRRHALWYRDLVERAETALAGPDQSSWLDRLEREHPNLRSAVAYAVDEGDGETALRLVASLRRYLDLRGHVAEGRRWLEAALAVGESADPLLRVRALGGAGVLAAEQGDLAVARGLFERSVTLARAVGAPDRVARELANLAHVAVLQGDRDSGRRFCEEAAEIQRVTGDRRNLALTLENLGCIALLEYDAERAMRVLGEAHDVARTTGDPQVLAATLTSFARALLASGSDARAGSLLEESIMLLTEVGWVQGMAECVELIALLEARRTEAARAAVLLGAADGLRSSIGASRQELEGRAYDEASAAARSSLGPEAFAAAWRQGNELPASEAVAVCTGTLELVT
jgi:predicted ATPase/DNA-binding SARP family transcriptional activator